MSDVSNSSRTAGHRLGTELIENCSGAIAPMAGLTALFILAAVGATIDLGQAWVAKSRLQNAIDAAALAATNSYQMDPDRNQAAATAKAMQFFQAATINVPGATATVAIDAAAGSVTIDAEAIVKTPFLTLVGFPSMTVNTRSEATASASIGTSSDVEIALMLDVTGSMGQASGSGGSKLEAMKASAKGLIDILIPNSGTPHAKVALAPFSRTVNVGDDLASPVTGLPLHDHGRHLKRCVTERKGAEALTDAAPGAGAWLPGYPNPADPYADNTNSARSCSPEHTVMPLTSDKSRLKRHIDDFDANGVTAGALGTAWAWYLLSPRWSEVFSGESVPRAYGTANLRKIAVLLTDGTYNTRDGNQHPDGSSEAESISQQAVRICNGMKAAGIEVFTIGFKLDNQLARDTMRDCATDSTYAFLAEDGVQLNAAFTDIAYRSVPLHLSK